jgi:hypothetical protein
MESNYSACLMPMPILFKASVELRSHFSWSPKLALAVKIGFTMNLEKSVGHRFTQINADNKASYARLAVHPIGAAKSSYKPLFTCVNPHSSVAQLFFSR